MVAPERYRELPGPRLMCGQREEQSGCPLPYQSLLSWVLYESSHLVLCKTVHHATHRTLGH